MATFSEQARDILAAMTPAQRAVWKKAGKDAAFRAAEYAGALKTEMAPQFADYDRHAFANAIRFCAFGYF